MGSAIRRTRVAGLALAVALPVLGLPSFGHAADELPPADQGVPTRAVCGPGSRPETGVQGRVSLSDRQSGRSQHGYSCNLSLVGRYQGEGATWVNPSHNHCAYMGTSFGGLLTKRSPGTQVVDVTDKAQPTLSTNLTSSAMLTDTWESLKVNGRRQLLGGLSVGSVLSGLFFDVYDITDCANPRLLNGLNGTPLTVPANILGHEGNWAPDGRTYYASGLVAGSLTAIDTSDPTHPRIVYTGVAGIPANHGISVSADGNRMYVSRIAPAGVDIIDISSIQRRDPLPLPRHLGGVSWLDGSIGQHTIPITKDGKPYLVSVDEFGAGGIKFIDVSDERAPKVTDRLRLEIQTTKYVEQRNEDTQGNGFFGYESHYCSVNRVNEPTRLACGFFQSGVRVFDITDMSRPREIAYYNPPAQVGKRDLLRGSEHAVGLGTSGILGATASDVQNGGLLFTSPSQLKGMLEPANLTADWCTSPPQFRGTSELWVTCQDNGFMVLRFTNGAHG